MSDADGMTEILSPSPTQTERMGTNVSENNNSPHVRKGKSLH